MKLADRSRADSLMQLIYKKKGNYSSIIPLLDTLGYVEFYRKSITTAGAVLSHSADSTGRPASVPQLLSSWQDRV